MRAAPAKEVLRDQGDARESGLQATAWTRVPHDLSQKAEKGLLVGCNPPRLVLLTSSLLDIAYGTNLQLAFAHSFLQLSIDIARFFNVFILISQQHQRQRFRLLPFCCFVPLASSEGSVKVHT